jgi:ubiquinone/menaquinone biosynthesis C-methylase UbiE
MLEKARERGLDVQEGSATALPFGDGSFDVTCSFKVLAHIPDIEKALSEMARVTRVGGHVLAEFYNPHSLRALLKRYGPAGKVADDAHEKNVFLRFDSPTRAKALTPRGCEFVGARGIRIVTPTAHFMRVPLLRTGLSQVERLLCDSPMKAFAGFYVASYRKL